MQHAVVPTKEQETKKTTSRVFNFQCVLGKQGKTKKSPSLAHLSAWFYILNKPLAHSPTAQWNNYGTLLEHTKKQFSARL